jgi:uncharacterized RDD family membrane protein YckC
VCRLPLFEKLSTVARNFIRPLLFGCLCSLLTFVVAIALAVLAGMTFGAVTVVKLLPSLALLLAILAFVLGYCKESGKAASADRVPHNDQSRD